MGRKRAKWTGGRLSKWIRLEASLSFSSERSNIYRHVALLFIEASSVLKKKKYKKTESRNTNKHLVGGVFTTIWPSTFYGPGFLFNGSHSASAACRSAAPDAAGRSESRSRRDAEWARSVRFCSQATKDLLLFFALWQGQVRARGPGPCAMRAHSLRLLPGMFGWGMRRGGRENDAAPHTHHPQLYSAEEHVDEGLGGDDNVRQASPARVRVCLCMCERERRKKGESWRSKQFV